MNKFLNKFRKDEDGAVTVDWVVLTAAVVALAGAAYTSISSGTTSLTESTGSFISGKSPSGSGESAVFLCPAGFILRSTPLRANSAYRESRSPLRSGFCQRSKCRSLRKPRHSMNTFAAIPPPQAVVAPIYSRAYRIFLKI